MCQLDYLQLAICHIVSLILIPEIRLEKMLLDDQVVLIGQFCTSILRLQKVFHIKSIIGHNLQPTRKEFKTFFDFDGPHNT